jgi:hypothetical protein
MIKRTAKIGSKFRMQQGQKKRNVQHLIAEEINILIEVLCGQDRVRDVFVEFVKSILDVHLWP